MSEDISNPGTPQPRSSIFPQLSNLSLRTRLVIAITLLTSLALIALGYFTFVRAQQAQTFLHDQLQATVGKQAQESLQNSAQTAASQANQYLVEVTDALNSEVTYFENIQKNAGILDTGIYWNAHLKMRRASAGQWGNPTSDIASVLVPSTVTLDDTSIQKLNTYIYLDFIAPGLLDKNKGIVATYLVDPAGMIIYYPNIDLANVVGDYNATTQAYYQNATPEKDPEHKSIWSVPYQDHAKTGLVVTNSKPVFDKNGQFAGIVAMDVQLASIATQLSALKVGDTGYAFLIDSAGHIMQLPGKGYLDFGITPVDVPVGEPITQTVLGHGTEPLQALTQKMTQGEKGFATMTLNGVEKYIAYAPLPTTGYSLGLVAPTAELNQAFIAANAELEKQTSQTVTSTLLLSGTILLITAILGWLFGRLLTNPLNSLTATARQIAAGNLDVSANANSTDEIGTLGKAFNAMTSRLRDSISNLENRVADRTTELAAVNQSIEKRAVQLRTVSEIARSAASLKELDALLPEITRRISEGFGVYHVGIFLLDLNREYAVLKASNSDGGTRMLARNHRLKVGQVGIVGFVTQTGQSRIALDVGEDAVFFNNPDLPDTHSEIALPLTVGNQIIGALDVQSTQSAAFSNEDIDTLGLLADQISIAIENARLFEETRTALKEAQNIYTQSALASWREINRQGSISGFRYSNGAIETLGDKSSATLPNPGNNETLSIPITIRGQSLGFLNIRQPGRTQAWRDSEIRLFQSIVERLSFALENARLYVDAQKRATKERVIGEIGAKISGSVNLENVLQTVIEELGRTIPGSEVMVQFEGIQDGSANSGSNQ